MDNTNRYTGILLHISSLPSPYGIGTLGKEAYEFVDFLHSSSVKIWQMLPLTVTSYGDSPYQSPSSTGLNYYFIDLRNLIQQGLLTKKECDETDLVSDPNYVDYGKLFYNRIPLLKKAFSRFDINNKNFISFIKKGKYNDFSFFMTLKEINNFAPWYEFKDEYKKYSPELENKVIKENYNLFLFYQWTQFEFLDEYSKLKKYANLKGIKIFGDMPLYLAYDSIEAYKYSSLFQFDDYQRPKVVAGCPPDYFSKDGQLWGNPIYNWDKMKEDNFKWFTNRMDENLKIFDILRIDHFRGFSSYYAIPYGMKNARIGRWVKGPGFDLFKDKLNYPIIAEDLGTLDEDVYTLLKETTYPGMKVLEFAFDGDSKNQHKPSNSTTNYVCYTGTHDNVPLLGHLKELSQNELEVFKEDVKKECLPLDVDYDDSSLKALTLTCVKLCLASSCFMAVVPLQDLLALGKESRMNFPSSISTANWTYRAKKDDFSKDLIEFLKLNIKKYNR